MLNQYSVTESIWHQRGQLKLFDFVFCEQQVDSLHFAKALCLGLHPFKPATVAQISLMDKLLHDMLFFGPLLSKWPTSNAFSFLMPKKRQFSQLYSIGPPKLDFLVEDCSPAPNKLQITPF